MHTNQFDTVKCSSSYMLMCRELIMLLRHHFFSLLEVFVMHLRSDLAVRHYQTHRPHLCNLLGTKILLVDFIYFFHYCFEEMFHVQREGYESLEVCGQEPPGHMSPSHHMLLKQCAGLPMSTQLCLIKQDTLEQEGFSEIRSAFSKHEDLGWYVQHSHRRRGHGCECQCLQIWGRRKVDLQELPGQPTQHKW